MDEPGAALRPAEPSRWARIGVLFGFTKADLEHLGWVEQVTEDPAWMRRAARSRLVPQLTVYAVMSAVTGQAWFFVGAVIGIGLAWTFARDWFVRRLARSIRNLHGIGDKRSLWADWPPTLYLGFNLAMAVALVAVASLTFGWLGDLDEREPVFGVGFVDCTLEGSTMELEAPIYNPTDAPQLVTVEFRYVEAFGGETVRVPTVATLSPGTWQEVVATTEVGPDQGCFGTGATVRSPG